MTEHLAKAIASSTALGVANFLYEAFTYSDWLHAFEVTFFQAAAIFIFVFIWLPEDQR